MHTETLVRDEKLLRIGRGAVANEQVRLLGELEGLVRKQIELAHQGEAASERFSLLTDRAGSVVERISQLGLAGSQEYQRRFEMLRELYETLSLVLAAEKADVCEDLGRIRRGRKIIGTYRGTV